MVDRIKGVLLCGGEGTRLRPLTFAMNKHLVRVGDKPMAEYPLLKMIEAGIREVLIVCGGEKFAGLVRYFGSGKRWNVEITYKIQDEVGGIAQALGLARSFIDGCKVLVLLGDNIWNADISSHVELFRQSSYEKCLLFSTSVKNPGEYGVLQYDEKTGSAIDVLEKPKDPPSNDILAGIYLYGPEVFDIIKTLKPSQRNELEISDVNRYYLRGRMAKVVKLTGFWKDCGKFDSLKEAEALLSDD